MHVSPILILALLHSAPVAAQERSPFTVDLSGTADPAASGTTSPPVPESERPFAAALRLTSDDTAFRAAWAKSGEMLLPTSRSIGVANPVFGMLSVSGCRPSADGRCDLSITWRTAGPAGDFDQPRPESSWRPQPPPGGKPMLATSSMRLELDRTDPPGRYAIEVTVTDKVTGRRLIVAASALKLDIEVPRR
jgi:hypothetical protein